MTSSKGKLDAVYPALLAVMNNIGAYTEHLSATACSKLLQLFVSMASPSFLLANETNHTLLSSLLEFVNAVLEHQYSSKVSIQHFCSQANLPKKTPTLYTQSSGLRGDLRLSVRLRWKVDKMRLSGKTSKGRGAQVVAILSQAPHPTSLEMTFGARPVGDDR